MRLAIVRQRYTPFGGAERFVDQALSALFEHNVEVSLYTREWHPTKQSLVDPVICDPFYLGSTARDRSFARAVCSALRRDKPDLIQSHERIACCDIFRAGDGVHRVWLEQRKAQLGLWGKLGVALNPHHRYTLRAEARLFASPRLKAVICNSRMVRDEIGTLYHVAEEKLHVIYNAVDSEKLSPSLRMHRSPVRQALRIPQDAAVFLFVGSGFERKGLSSAIDALALLPGNTHLIVVGHDKRIQLYRDQVRARGLLNRVHLVGPQRNPETFYGSADAYVLPTLYDPCPNSVFEAMACGLPVVTTTKCGAAEVVVPRNAGLACEAGDISGLSSNMRYLLNPATRAAMGNAARSTACLFTPEVMTQQLLLLYHRLLGSARGKQERSPAQHPDKGSNRGIGTASGVTKL